MTDTFFSYFSELKINSTKSKIAGIDVLKGVQMAVCGMRCTDLNNDMLKIFGTHFSYNEKLKVEKFFYKTATDIQQVLKIWKMRNLTLEGKIVIFKTTAISKFVFQSFITTVPNTFWTDLENYKRLFYGKTLLLKDKADVMTVKLED